MPSPPRSKENAYLPPRMHKKYNTYYYVYSAEGKRKWINLGKNLNEAREKWAKYENDLENEVLISGSFKELSELYASKIIPEKSIKTQELNRMQLKKLNAVFGKMSLHKITPPHIAQYLEISSRKVSANREISLMSSIFSKGIRWGHCKENPCAGVEKNKEKPRDRYITDDELSLLCKFSNATIKNIIQLAYLTGMRRQDILSIKKEKKDDHASYLSNDAIYIVQKKTNKKQKFLLNESLSSVIESALKESNERSEYLFTNNKGEPFTKSGFRSAWVRLIDKVKIKGINFHDIRAKSATDAKMQGLDYQKLLGHTNKKMSDRYVKLRVTDVISPLEFSVPD